MISSRTSRYLSFNSVRTTHRGKPFLDLVNSKQWKEFISERLDSMEYNVATVPASMEFRPDIIANSAYGTVSLWWLVCLANSIIDPNKELVAGKIIKIPII